VKTAEKSNEITAMPKLLKMLNIEGLTVTTDAMGCQREIAKTIFDSRAGYVLQVKDNQPTMHKEIAEYFNSEIGDSLQPSPSTTLSTIDKDHGRLEEREYWHSSDIEWFADKTRWAGLTGFGYVRRKRTNLTTSKTSIEDHYYITSLQDDVALFAQAARGHWSIENQLHWVLDMAFDEDHSRIRRGHAAENFAILRHIALNLLKNPRTGKKGIKTKRKRCGWDHEYLLNAIGLRKN
jgi:predicted transposase YbfD/YdcC